MSQACSPVCPGIGRTMLSILLLSGLCSCLHRYHFIDEPKTWTEAQAYCREKYTDLATVYNMADMERLVAAAGSGYAGKVWIGLRYRPGSWKWSLSDPSFYEEGEWDFRKWKQHEPNDMRGRGKVCVFTRNGFWCDYSCSSPRMFVCYHRNLTDLATTSIDSYVFGREKKTWDEAQAYCREHYTDLASVRNDYENTMIQEATGDERAEFSIGLNVEDWSWWSDGANPTFKNWAGGHPRSLKESCAASVIQAPYLGEWVEYHCDKRHHFICYGEKKRFVFKVKLTALKSTIDLNDPAVMEAILNLIKERMEEKGFTKGFKTSWIKKPGKTIFHKEEENEG